MLNLLSILINFFLTTSIKNLDSIFFHDKPTSSTLKKTVAYNCDREQNTFKIFTGQKTKLYASVMLHKDIYTTFIGYSTRVYL